MSSRDEKPAALKIDFLHGAFDYRRKRVSRNEPLVRAVGLRSGTPLTVLDATAGLGRDGFLLAAAGAQVIMVERAPLVAQALQDALHAAHEDSAEMAEIASSIRLIHGEAREQIGTIAADVITIDPMHPERSKSALVKQPMRTLRDLVGTDPDSEALIAHAFAHNPGRVVVKWPLRAPLPPGVPAPSHEITTKTVRFAVFVRP